MGLETRDPKGGTRDPETRDLTHRWDPGPKTQDLKGGTLDPRSGTLILPGTYNPRPRTLKVVSRTLMRGETGDSKQTSLVKPGTQEL